MSDKSEAAARELWDAATNSVCQTMQERKMCNCPDGDCLAAKIDPDVTDLAQHRRALTVSKERMNDDEKQLIKDLAEGKVLTPNMAKALARQERKAAHRVATGQVTVIKPTGSPGASAADRARQRRMAKLKTKLDLAEDRKLLRRAAKALR